ncbi:MAG TPA: cob(I)yrinic acid a,c-diamide adenosyltransferase [Thermoplasmata archaeon]|nr:cob(I)yrinic acid a,c-diamide adenosyltransferase [Thermoplasmata archaeon]
MATGGESIPRLYTRTGDRGATRLSGGARVDKDSPRVRAYGAYDEVGAQLGVAHAALTEPPEDVRNLVRRLQHELFVVQSELAHASPARAPRHRIEGRHVQHLEADIDRLTAEVSPLRSFVLNGGSPAAAALHVARTVARRAEQELWTLHRSEPQRPELLQWANRLSDLLFALALSANHRAGVREVPPDYEV